jgi:hypothetical protein
VQATRRQKRPPAIDTEFLSFGCASVVLFVDVYCVALCDKSYSLEGVNLALFLVLLVFFVVGLDKQSRLIRINRTAPLSFLLAINLMLDSHLTYELTGIRDRFTSSIRVDWDTRHHQAKLIQSCLSAVVCLRPKTAAVKWLGASHKRYHHLRGFGHPR